MASRYAIYLVILMGYTCLTDATNILVRLVLIPYLEATYLLE